MPRRARWSWRRTAADRHGASDRPPLAGAQSAPRRSRFPNGAYPGADTRTLEAPLAMQALLCLTAGSDFASLAALSAIYAVAAVLSGLSGFGFSAIGWPSFRGLSPPTGGGV